MGFDEVKRIKSFLSAFDSGAVYLTHEPVITSEDAAKTRGFELKQGIKAILLTNGENSFVVVNVPADKKVDLKKVAEFLLLPRNKLRMATPEEVMEQTGCEIGAVPPFGHKERIKTLIDSKIYDNEENAFNIGTRTHSVKIKTKIVEYIFRELKMTEGDFSK